MLAVHVVGKGQSQPVETVTCIKALTAVKLQSGQGTGRHLIGNSICTTGIINKIETLANNLRPQLMRVDPVHQLGTTG